VNATEVIAGLAESNGSLPPGRWLSHLWREGLTACTPGSAPAGPTPSNGYEKILPFYHTQVVVWLRGFHTDSNRNHAQNSVQIYRKDCLYSASMYLRTCNATFFNNFHSIRISRLVTIPEPDFFSDYIRKAKSKSASRQWRPCNKVPCSSV